MVTRSVLDVLDVLTPTKLLSVYEARNIITLQLKSKHYTYVGYIDGIPVCMASFIILAKLGRNGSRSALIEDVAVLKDCQCKGYGRKIVDFVTRKAESYGVYKVILNCSVENEGFYRRCGYKNAGCYMRKDV